MLQGYPVIMPPAMLISEMREIVAAVLWISL
jgi:hypothetical protein